MLWPKGEKRVFMKAGIKAEKLHIDGMSCVNCQNKVEKKLRGTPGVQTADVSYAAGTAKVTYDADVISVEKLAAIIQKLGYQVVAGHRDQNGNAARSAGLLLVIASLYLLLEHFGFLNLLVPSQLAEANMEYGMLFVIGLITSVHCVAMCGGINLSQCIPKSDAPESEGRFSSLRPAFLYNLGRVISYTAVGFVVGALGSIVTFSPAAQGVLKLIAGGFMVLMGFNMLGIFPSLRALTPRMPKQIAQRIDSEKAKSGSPLVVGLLNGLMPCGPLQAMQIYALSTGNAFAGALSMLLFSLGTVPLMFGLGALSSALGRRFTKKVMTVGAVLVAVLGLSMLSQGWSLSGFSTGQTAALQGGAAVSGPVLENGVQVVRSTLSPGQYPQITVWAGTPVKWIIDAPKGSINGCNNRIFIQEYGVEHSFKTGENVITFTPEETGTFGYSCWMGMIRSSITVAEPGTEIEPPSAGTSQGSILGAPGYFSGPSCCG
ncbi:sulfite exporter TauE/SafE family protein [Oscillibacter sp.]|uniref:urease accessory protein UreH domain-containing protein n=1 Tax=Oscillibacter sp. TaxID=1945593 RepID=UPI0028A1F65C|nr:sulfite exporter TauE/SafE family protein [Oscillibacter sp.]